MTGARVLPFGGRALLVELTGTAAVHRLWRDLWAAREAGDGSLRGVEEIVPGAGTVLVAVGPAPADLSPLAAFLASRAAAAEDAAGAGVGGTGRPPGQAGERDPVAAGVTEVTVRVVYDGQDLAHVADLAGISPAEVVERHCGSRYTVAFLGFAPGFAYLEGLDPVLGVPRRAEPRASVPAGSVAVANGMSAVYPAAMPGGWHLIGRTDSVMFDPGRVRPALLGTGDRVRFVPVDGLGAPTPEAGGRGPAGAPAPDGARPPPAGAPTRRIEVLRAGPRTTVQDRGRIGHAHEGVPRAGAADLRSLAAVNALVGNPPEAAALETTLSGPALRFPSGGLVALAGADAPATVDGEPVTAWPATVAPGGVLDVGAARRGLRTYVGVAGGVAVPAVLGSRSCDTLSGLGPPPLRAGDVLPLGPPVGPPARVVPPGPPLPAAEDVVRARVLPGPRADRLGPGGLERLAAAQLTVSPVSDRTGLRLEGDRFPVRDAEAVGSEGMVAGAVQVPPGGRPIVLLCNHATTGGYPVVAVVAEEDLPTLAQARPGTRVRFELLGGR